METFATIKFVLDNYKELGGSASALLASLVFAHYKFIQKQLNNVKTQIKEDQKGDREQFQELKSILDGLLVGAADLERNKKAHSRDLKRMAKEIEKMLAGLEAQEKMIVDNAHKIELNEVTINTLRGLMTDLVSDTKKFGERANAMEMSLAKMLGALSKNFD